MPLKISCPQCRKPLTVPDQLAGRTGKCPGCGASVSVPPLPPPPTIVAAGVASEPIVATVVQDAPSPPPSLPPADRFPLLRSRTWKYWLALVTSSAAIVLLTFAIAAMRSSTRSQTLRSDGTPRSEASTAGFSQISAQEARTRIEKLGGTIYPKYQQPEAIGGVSFSGCTITDSDLAILQAFDSIPSLNLSKTQVTDRGIDYLVGLEINELNCNETAVTDEGMRSIAKLRNLNELLVANTQVSLAGVAMLENKSSFRRLVVENTRILAAAYGKLRKMFPSAYIFLSHATLLCDDEEWGEVNTLIFSELAGDDPEALAFEVRVINNLAKQSNMSPSKLREFVHTVITNGRNSGASSPAIVQTIRSSLGFRAALD